MDYVNMKLHFLQKVIVTPRGRRRSSIFRKHRNANDK